MGYQVTTIHEDDAITMPKPRLSHVHVNQLSRRAADRNHLRQQGRPELVLGQIQRLVGWTPMAPWFTMSLWCIKIIPMKSGAPQTGSTGHSPCSTLLQHYQTSGPRTIRNSAASTSTINASPASSQQWDYWFSNSQSGTPASNNRSWNLNKLPLNLAQPCWISCFSPTPS